MIKRYTTDPDGHSSPDPYDGYVYIDGKKVVGEYTLSDLPGDMDVAVSHGVCLRPEYRGKGLGQLQHAERLERIYSGGYMAAICTVRSENLIEKHILRKNKWKPVWTFTNKDGDLVELWAHQDESITTNRVGAEGAEV